MSNKDQIIQEKMPRHVAVIMDGNGRWANSMGMERVMGHDYGVKAVKDVVEGAVEIGLEYLSLYTFSTENWRRPKAEVNALMELLVKTIHAETETLLKNRICLNAIGDLKSLPGECFEQLEETRRLTEKNNRLTLTLALSYSSRWEILEAAKRIARRYKAGDLSMEEINEGLFSSELTTSNIPDPELMIRTSGEQRISNFLLWQMAYTELWFTEKYWPEFTREDLYQALIDFQNRERRFGKTGSQLKEKS